MFEQASLSTDIVVVDTVIVIKNVFLAENIWQTCSIFSSHILWSRLSDGLVRPLGTERGLTRVICQLEPISERKQTNWRGKTFQVSHLPWLSITFQDQNTSQIIKLLVTCQILARFKIIQNEFQAFLSVFVSVCGLVGLPNSCRTGFRNGLALSQLGCWSFDKSKHNYVPMAWNNVFGCPSKRDLDEWQKIFDPAKNAIPFQIA